MRRAARPLTFLVAALVVTARASAATPTGILHGSVVRGPVTPVCRVGVPCDEPAADVVLAFSRGGVTRTTRSNGRGLYRIALPSGFYSVRTSATRFGQIPRPASVHVRAGRSDRIDFAVDTGIR